MEFLKIMKTSKKKNNKIKLVTHNGSFHTDDVFACATLALMLEAKKQKFEVIRTRDEKIIQKGDYVFDVGGIYKPGKNLFDHHQKSFQEKRKNGILYSSFGLVWKKYGKEIAGSEKTKEWIDRRLVTPVDANDNGFDLIEKKYDIFPYLIQDFFRVMRPTWRETDLNIDKMFLKSVLIAKELLLREVAYAEDTLIADEKILSIYKKTKDKRIIVLDKNYAKKEVLNKLHKALFIVYPREVDNSWGVEAIRKDFISFVNKKNLPANWAGLRDQELQKISGVPDAVFCHRGLFLAVARSKNGALKLADLALKN